MADSSIAVGADPHCGGHRRITKSESPPDEFLATAGKGVNFLHFWGQELFLKLLVTNKIRKGRQSFPSHAPHKGVPLFSNREYLHLLQ